MSTDAENLWLAEQWQMYRERLRKLLAVRMPEVLMRRLSVDDLMQETYVACGRRMEFLKAEPEVPMYLKLRRIALQVLADQQRHHLGAGKRDAMKESELPESDDRSMEAWAQFVDTMSSPRTHMVRLERQALTRRVLGELSPADREILELRHFEDLGNTECAMVLGIAPKAASIRYVRALKRLRDLLEGASLY
ncbi:MAG TPA: sigma-70 family RNA polymerase sigma factor [Candidatus Akkermansia intestinavium]|nr:sigma-70 family RNA polymerase sigma factor [Candidatus Akkermansia intestinavium]